jgi:hypothetical protein
MEDPVHEIPDHLKPHIRHARHHSPDGKEVVFRGPTLNEIPNQKRSEWIEYVNSLRRVKGLPEVE